MKYFINMDGQTYGPFSFINITQLPICKDTLICTDTPDGGWKEAREYAEFLHLFQNSETSVSEQGTQQPEVSSPTPENLPSQEELVSQPTRLPPGYAINEFGEIIKNKPDSMLPADRGYKTTIFLTILTCGFYGLILPFLLGKETNITCKDDGENMPGFVKSIFLSIIGCGIPGLFLICKWCNREANFLRKHHSTPLLTGGGFFVSSVLSVSMIVIGSICLSEAQEDLMILGIALLALGVIIFLAIIGRMNIQHNLVNKVYNVENCLQESDSENDN